MAVDGDEVIVSSVVRDQGPAGRFAFTPPKFRVGFSADRLRDIFNAYSQFTETITAGLTDDEGEFDSPDLENDLDFSDPDFSESGSVAAWDDLNAPCERVPTDAMNIASGLAADLDRAFPDRIGSSDDEYEHEHEHDNNNENEDENDIADDDEYEDDELELVGRLPTMDQLRTLGFSNQPSLAAFTAYRSKLVEWYSEYYDRLRLTVSTRDSAVPFGNQEASASVSDSASAGSPPSRFSLNLPTGFPTGFPQSFAPQLPNMPNMPNLPNLPSFPLTQFSLPGMPTERMRDFLNRRPFNFSQLPDPQAFAREIEANAAALDIKEIHVGETDVEPSFSPSGRRGCLHYERNCKVHCIECEKWYPCRHCHDEVEPHPLPRQGTKYMLCMLCETPQLAGQSCAKCHQEMATYFCGLCKLWSSTPEKPIFHCHDCGICRIGQGLGIDTFHCHGCGTCMNLALENNHRCIDRITHSNCPICQDYLFNSTKIVRFMKCGHPIHDVCFKDLLHESYRCPICSRSVVDTSAIFRIIDDEVAHEALPPEYADLKVNILCHDCNGRSRVPFHLAGLKCSICLSYNTTRV